MSWCFKVDGKARHFCGGVKEVVIRDVEFVDDTALMGHVEELASAEKSFVQILRDWDQQEHECKRGSLILVPGSRGK